MNMIPSPALSAQTPAVVRIAVQRLLAWLPMGPIAVLGDDAPGLVRGLRQAGVVVQKVADPGSASAGIIVVEHAGSITPESGLRPLLEGIAGPVCLVVVGDAADSIGRAGWEAAAIRSEWRKHPLNERVAPYGELDRVTGLLLIAFERVPASAIAKYPLKALEEERDLHTDMTREPGRRSDAHMTRYAQAAQFIRPGDRVIDVACGLGYGSYQLANNSTAASFTGLDASDYAVDYANANFAGVSPTPMTFVVGDAQNLSGMADGSADFAVSVETLEHLPEPDRLLAELHRVLTPHGRVYASVPNDWSDETGEDPNPFHFHVYDWPRLVAQFQRNGFVIERAWLQDAGGGQKRHLSARSMLEIDPLVGPPSDGEWLLVLARKAEGHVGAEDDAWQRARALLADGSGAEAVEALVGEFESTGALRRARARAFAAIVAAAEGDVGTANAHWTSVQADSRSALSSSEDEADAAALLCLALDQLQHAHDTLPGAFQRTFQARADVVRELLGLERSNPSENDDRAVASGPLDGAEHIHLGSRDVRQLMDAKDWLDSQYHLHTQRIVELERYNAELEQARHWLDGQYHALTAEIERLNRMHAPAVDAGE